MTVAPGSILTWLAIREVLKKRNFQGSTILDAGCGDAWMTMKLDSVSQKSSRHEAFVID